MDIRIKAHDFVVTEDTSAYLEERLKTIENHLGADAEGARVEVELGRGAGHSKHGDNWFAQMRIVITGSDLLHAEADAETVNAAIDILKDEMLAVLKKSRTRRIVVARKIGAKVKEWLHSDTEEQ